MVECKFLVDMEFSFVFNDFDLESSGFKASMMRYTIWYHLHNLKNVKNTHGGVLFLVTKSNTPTWVLLTFFKLYKSRKP